MPESPLNSKSAAAVAQILENAHGQGRTMLYEHEVYAILMNLRLNVPTHHLVTQALQITPQLLSGYKSDKLVLKAVAPDIAHKQKAGAVEIAVKDLDFIKFCFDRMKKRLEDAGHRVEGILLVEFVEYSKDLGNEILLGFRESDAFGPVISFSKGGSDAEHFAKSFSPPNLIRAPIDRKWAEALLYSTRIQEKYAQEGKKDYTAKAIEAGLKFSDLAVSFSKFFDSGSRFVIKEFEVNPFIFDPQGRFLALDGYAVFEPRHTTYDNRLEFAPASVETIFNPEGVAVVGVSTQNQEAPGTIIANNLVALGRDDVYCVNPKGNEIRLEEKVLPIYPAVDQIPAHIELAVISVPAKFVLDVVNDCARKAVKAIILIPGGFSETGNSHGEDVEHEILAIARKNDMRLLGPNCLGVVYLGNEEAPGINTFFIPEKKLKLTSGQNRRVALISQSGALGLTELHNLRHSISPRAIVSYGNQLDIDPSDLIAYFGNSDQVDVIGCYIEGFKPGAGARFYNEASRCPKPVIVYKAGRTEAGQKATQSHTASMAGEYAVAKATMKQAGLVVAETVMEHKDLIKTFALFNDFSVTGNRVGIIANAGYEKTYAADNLGGLEVAVFDEATNQALSDIIPPFVSVDPLLDLTPMADDSLFERSIDTVLSSNKVDCLFISIVPHTPALNTTDEEMADDPENVAFRIVRQVRKHRKPVVVSICITAGADVVYNRFGQVLEEGGVPTFLSASQAMCCLNGFVRYRMMKNTGNYSEWLK
ncbi:MAG: hypothetical protein GY874_19405 [Desulfobacteraceae bacterium]|nr:hypothetical protein [Desulfobacteraceae bacterium]